MLPYFSFVLVYFFMCAAVARGSVERLLFTSSKGAASADRTSRWRSCAVRVLCKGAACNEAPLLLVLFNTRTVFCCCFARGFHFVGVETVHIFTDKYILKYIFYYEYCIF